MAVIKFLPEDFVVNEIQSRSFRNEGNFAYFWMTKDNITTLLAEEEIASELKIQKKRISVAGYKDRRAITCQLLSIEGVSARELEKFFLPRIQLKFAGYDEKPLHLGDLDANEFTIIVRDLDPSAAITPCEYFLNLFGPQRFSKNNVEIGGLLLRQQWSRAVELLLESSDYAGVMREFLDSQPKNKIGALKLLPTHLLKMYVHAFQSMVWNEAVEELRDSINGSLSLPGFNTSYPAHAAEVIARILRRHEVQERDFILRNFPEISLEGVERPVQAVVSDFSSEISDDELHPGKRKAVLHFILGKGSYATVAVRYLVSEPVDEFKPSKVLKE